MSSIENNSDSVKTTSYKVVLPFYIYAALAFLTASIFVFLHSTDFNGHYFQPHLLAITHTMALGWATMIILGSCHQLVPVLIEGKLHSEGLAKATFIFAAIGIPLLVYAFYFFELNIVAIIGGSLIVFSILLFFINLSMSISKSKKENVHAAFIFTSSLWLLITVSLGLLLIYNFTHLILSKSSLQFLSLHAHIGIIGWFSLLVIGVSSRLIPMFLISKYNNSKLLWVIFVLINSALIIYILFYFSFLHSILTVASIALFLIAIFLFVKHIYASYIQRIRKKVDEQMQLSLLSILMLFFPIIISIILIAISLYFKTGSNKVVLLYGFMIFFGWLTAIILGMTFKTLPFIVWNKVYHNKASQGKTINPKDLFSSKIYKMMAFSYIISFLFFCLGLFLPLHLFLKVGAVILILTALLYNLNVFKILLHKTEK
ncbi:MAG: cytochrome C oxidase subunit I [Bacteroidetes bacterium]|nr:cytochrome C oxidase subunit I [Bacteroidota bacterium]